MRRAVVLGLVVLVVAVWFLGRPAPERWVVAVEADHIALDFHDPCPMEDLIVDGYTTGGGSFGGLLVTTSEDDARVVASCYDTHGIHAEVRRRTAEDKARIEDVTGDAGRA